MKEGLEGEHGILRATFMELTCGLWNPFQGVVFREKKMVISHSQQIKNFLASLVKRGQSKDWSVAMLSAELTHHVEESMQRKYFLEGSFDLGKMIQMRGGRK